MKTFSLLIVLLLSLGSIDSSFAAKKSRIHRHPQRSSNTSYVPPVTIQGSAQLATQITNIINSTKQGADVAVFVKSMKYNDALYARNAYLPMTPASTMKILTAEAALLFLGPDYRFSTQLLTDSKSINNGVLQGNLYVVFSGDPSLTYNDLSELLDALKDQHIRAIAGNVYIDNSAYDQRFYGPGWKEKDKRFAYAAPISASIINHNTLAFHLPSNRTLSATERDAMVTAPTKQTACSIRVAADANSLLSIDGCMNKSMHSLGLSYVVTDIPEYNRALIRNALLQKGITIYRSVTFGSAPDNLSLVNSHASDPLRDIIREMLKKSDNVIAGALFKKMGQLYTRKPGSWENGSMAVSQILARQANVDISGMRILDGSGLSEQNLTTPAQLMQVLNFAYHNVRIGGDFIDALPIAGIDGTLKHRMGNITRKIRAKTGTISGVISLAGYATAKNNETLAFVIMINGQKGFGWRYRSMEDKIATALTRYQR